MLGRLRLVLLALLLMSSGAQAAAPQKPPRKCEKPVAGPLDYAGLRRLIESRQIASVDELLPCLPVDLRSHFTFVYESRSPEKDAVDALRPRVLIFGSDARLVLAYTGSPTARHGDQLQTMEFDEATSSFAFREIRFAEAGNTFDETPTTCAECHGKDPHPIWESYDFWPGMYGSADDSVFRDTPEYDLYTRFLRSQRHAGRYAALRWPSYSKLPPYEELYIGTLDTAPNMQLNKLLYRYNAKRVFREIRESPHYQERKYDAAMGLLGCEPFPIDNALLKRVKGSLDRDFAAKVLRNGDRSYPFQGGVRALPVLAARLVKLAQLFEVPTTGWAPQLEPDSLDTSDGDALLDDFLLTEIYRDLMTLHPELKPFLRVISEGVMLQPPRFDPDSTSGERYRNGPKYVPLLASIGGSMLARLGRKSCGILKEKRDLARGLRESPSVAVAVETPVEAISAVAIAQVKPAAPVIAALSEGPHLNVVAKHCGGCHFGDDKATVIPFNDEAELQTMLRLQPRLAEEMVRRIHSRGPRRMPPSHVLTPGEIAAVEQFIRGLARPALPLKEAARP